MKLKMALISMLLVLGAVPLGFASTDSVAIVVSSPADGIVAAPYAKAMGYKLVITPKNELSKEAESQLKDVNKVIIVGGPVAVSENVENSIKALNKNTERVAGETRIETSMEMYKLIKKENPKMLKNIVIADGFDEKVTPVAVSFGAPVLYYGLNKDDEIVELLKNTNPENAVVIGTKIPKTITNTITNQAKNTIIASGNEENAVKTALAYVTKLNPKSENKGAFVVYAGESNSPILNAVMNFVNGDFGTIAPIPNINEDTINKIISKITFASEISISSDNDNVADEISNIAVGLGISATTSADVGSGGGGSPYTSTTDEKPVINTFNISISGLDTTFNISVSDDNELKKIVIKYGDGTENEMNVSGKSYHTTISRNYLMQGNYIAKITVYDDKNQATTLSKDINLNYIDITPEYLSKIITGNVNETIPINITNYMNKNITITTQSSNTNITISNVPSSINTSNVINVMIANTSSLVTGTSYQAKVIFALQSCPEINKTFTFDMVIPTVETKTTTSGSSVTLQVVNTTNTTTNTNIEINDSTTNEFKITTTVDTKTLDFAIPTTNTTNTSTIENTTIHIENIVDVLTRAEEIQSTSTLTEELIQPVVVASKDVGEVSVNVNNITIDDTNNEATLNTEISFNDTATNNTFVVVAIPVGNNSVNEISKDGYGLIPQYDGSGTQENYYIYDETNGIITLFMKKDPMLKIRMQMKVMNQPPIIDYTYNEDGLNVLINASNSYDPENKSLTFKWSAPGNKTVNYLDGGKTINITYPVDGNYDIKLILSDGIYEVSSIITVTVAQPIDEKPAIKIIANGKIVEFKGQDSNTLSIVGSKTINFPTLVANVNVVNKKDVSKNIEMYFKDNNSVKSIIESLNNYKSIAYNGDNVIITYNNPDMNGKNVTLSVIPDRSSIRDAINTMLNGNASDLIGLIEMNQYSMYNCTKTIANNEATWTIPASDFNGEVAVIVTEGNLIPYDATDVNILATGGFLVPKYNVTLTFIGTNTLTNETTYNISLNTTPTNNVRYGLAMINRNTNIFMNVEGTNPNNNLFNVSVQGNSGSELIVENNDFIKLNASKITNIINTIFTPNIASSTYSDITTNNKIQLSTQNITDSYVIGIVYDTVDKKIVAIEQQ